MIWAGELPPLEQSIRSTPIARMRRASSIDWPRSHPSSTQSVAEMRASSGSSAGQTSRTAAATSSGKRMRPSRSPPYSSVRVFDSGDRNSCMR